MYYILSSLHHHPVISYTHWQCTGTNAETGTILLVFIISLLVGTVAWNLKWCLRYWRWGGQGSLAVLPETRVWRFKLRARLSTPLVHPTKLRNCVLFSNNWLATSIAPTFFEISTWGFLQCLDKSILHWKYQPFFWVRPHELVNQSMITRDWNTPFFNNCT